LRTFIRISLVACDILGESLDISSRCDVLKVEKVAWCYLNMLEVELIEPIFYSDVTMLWENKRVPLFDERGMCLLLVSQSSQCSYQKESKISE